jgi:peptide/nickel transport system ATP-binding protein
MIASALSGDPLLLIADEPTTALDVTVQKQILQLIDRQRRERGLAVLLITHDLAVVAALAERVAVMYAGEIVEEGPTRAILEDARHPYTQALVRASLLQPGKDGALYALKSRAAEANGLDRGCRFRPRCALAEARGLAAQCENEAPTLVSRGNGRSCRCWADAAG